MLQQVTLPMRERTDLTEHDPDLVVLATQHGHTLVEVHLPAVDFQTVVRQIRHLFT
jgi:hypothetical protein